jgi:uncharacterized iron-regulated protein
MTHGVWRVGALLAVLSGCAGAGSEPAAFDGTPLDPERDVAGADPGEPSSPTGAEGAGGDGEPDDIVGRASLPLYGLTELGELREPELWAALAQSRVVCLGETHDNPAHHFAQLRALRELATRSQASGLSFAVGFEMFQTPFQSTLSRFAAGEIDERQLLAGSEYVARWGYDFALYRPLLELVRMLDLPALALNAPVELTERIGDVGLDGLTPAERASLPELELEDPEYREYVYELLGSSHGAGFGGVDLDKPYSVQVVWDETMAQSSSNWLVTTGDAARLAVIAGLGHCHHSAIPARITRRTGLPVLAVAPILASQLGAPGFPTLERYDLLLVLDDQR